LKALSALDGNGSPIWKRRLSPITPASRSERNTA
jgi:hypothetical protein